MDMMPGIFRKHSWWADRRDLFTLLQHFGLSRTTEPRDINYALCGNSTDASGPGILTPDYEMLTHKLVQDVSKFLFLYDLTGVAGLRLVSITDLATRVEQLNHIAILGHIQNKDKTSCMRLISCETSVSRLRAAGAYARLCGSSMLDKVLRRNGIVLRRRDPIQEVFQDSGCDTIEFLISNLAALQHHEREAIGLIFKYRPLGDIADASKQFLSGNSRASWAHSWALAMLAAWLFHRWESFTTDRRLLP
ncbi:uncharacterized protein ColSpa_10832 [Colletotrichum spaethianum]|uniref:Uncharacterized protein n=1 Tax=Colletotrichum spaethianum TaxID=700344 RepID=A0AA37PE83_9PEZI|nr:uncharacterized protein ColSpa_10832 [Colletotrichum spaethianum]GKT50651.1 hypothetical protein ColSpa_10832 [Colletotrichum spaethianum]